MDIHNLHDAERSFQPMAKTHRAQTAVMCLQPGESSSTTPNTHPHSDQVLYVVSGVVIAEISDERRVMNPGDSVIVPANTPHRFINDSGAPVVTFNVYCPPAY